MSAALGRTDFGGATRGARNSRRRRELTEEQKAEVRDASVFARSAVCRRTLAFERFRGTAGLGDLEFEQAGMSCKWARHQKLDEFTKDSVRSAATLSIVMAQCLLRVPRAPSLALALTLSLAPCRPSNRYVGLALAAVRGAERRRECGRISEIVTGLSYSERIDIGRGLVLTQHISWARVAFYTLVGGVDQSFSLLHRHSVRGRLSTAV